MQHWTRLLNCSLFCFLGEKLPKAPIFFFPWWPYHEVRVYKECMLYQIQTINTMRFNMRKDNTYVTHSFVNAHIVPPVCSAAWPSLLLVNGTIPWLVNLCLFCNTLQLVVFWVPPAKQFSFSWRLKGSLEYCTVGPRLSGHQLSGYLYYPAMILQYILSIFN